MTRRDLFRVRIAMLQAYMAESGLDGVLLNRVDNFAMATGGKRNYVNLFQDGGVCGLFVTKDGKVHFVGNTIESPRIMDEELAGCDCDVIEYKWFDSTAAEAVSKRFSGKLASDDGSLGANVHKDLVTLRALLTTTELEKYRVLGKLASDAMSATLQTIEPGMTESDIASLLINAGAQQRCHVPVALVAADERIAKYRHPVPTVNPLMGGDVVERSVRQYVMVVGCFQREGLVVSLTRFKQVDTLPKEIEDAYNRVCGVDALVQESTVPGRTMGDVFRSCQEAYVAMGFAEDEWHNHHQGGLTGYGARTVKGSPGEAFPILDTNLGGRAAEIAGVPLEFGQAFAWNPSARGVKSEDTFLLLPDGSKEIVTATPELPEVNLDEVLGRETAVVKSGMAV